MHRWSFICAPLEVGGGVCRRSWVGQSAAPAIGVVIICLISRACTVNVLLSLAAHFLTLRIGRYCLRSGLFTEKKIRT